MANKPEHLTSRRFAIPADSDSLQSQSLTVQMVSNPSWYAVMALPYLMEYPYECSEQVFNRMYANALARHIVNSDPKIARVFEQWRGTDALDSPLEKNEDLRNVLIAESPWLQDAKKESQARRDVGILFDDNRLNAELKRALDKLAEMQYSDGAWPWFPGGPANDYITLYVTTGFGRLRHLNVDIDTAPALRSLDRLDNWIKQIYDEIVRRGQQGPEPLVANDLPVFVRPQFLFERQTGRRSIPGSLRLLRRTRQTALGKTWRPSVSRSSGDCTETHRRSGDAGQDHGFSDRTQSQRRGNGNVLA